MVSRLGANKAFFILFGLFTLALYMLFTLVSKIAPLTISHTIYYCQKALSNILLTLPHLAPPLIALVLISIILIGLSLLAIHLSKTYLFIRKALKNKVITPQKVNNIAKKLSLVNKIDVVKNGTLSSFCYGLIKPRLCLSLKLVRTLNKKELEAVLIHESYHLKSRDPLKILLSQIAASMFFFVPTLKDFHDYYTLSKEVAADQLAVQSRYIKDLKSALTKVLLNPIPTLSGVASFANGGDLEQRVHVLTNSKKLSIKISFARLLTSLTVFILALVALNMPVYAIEDGEGNHAYFICPYGGECTLSCTKQGIMNEIPFSTERVFTPATYSPNN